MPIYDDIKAALEAIPEQDYGVAVVLSDLLEDQGDYDTFYHTAGFVDGVVCALMNGSPTMLPNWLAKIQSVTLPDMHPDADTRLTSAQRGDLILILKK